MLSPQNEQAKTMVTIHSNIETTKECLANAKTKDGNHEQKQLTQQETSTNERNNITSKSETNYDPERYLVKQGDLIMPREEGVLRTEQGEERPLGDVHEEASHRTQELREETMIRKEEGRERAVQEIDDTEDMGDAKEKGRGVMGRVRDMRDNMRDRIPQQHKERANEYTERARKFLSEEYFPEGRRDQFIFRGKKVILECQKHQDYQSSIRWLLSFIETYSTHARNAGTHASSHTSEHVIQDPKLCLAVAELRTILERFANGQNMDVIFSAVERLAQDSRNDEELRAWFWGVDTCYLSLGKYWNRTVTRPQACKMGQGHNRLPYVERSLSNRPWDMNTYPDLSRIVQ
ncbi:hypothetical protein BDQ17DRAFT_1514014 [Cyathus striatus]|nr:hypothetical protein BDQ17DRAFT_1514014 [Cyathus striatus]